MPFGNSSTYGFSSGGGGGSTSALTFISVTKAQLDVLVGGSTLVPGSFYKITDRGDLGILVQATSANTISLNGIRYMLCPTNYTPGAIVGAKTSLGVWNNALTPAAGNTAIWGGLVWLNNTGNVGNITNQAALAGPDWTVIPKATFADGEYTPMQFGVTYDYANDFISQQWDKKGNVFGVSYQEFTDGSVSTITTGNPCDMSDWNFSTMTSVTTNFALFFGNKCQGVFNNSTRDALQAVFIVNNNINGLIYANIGGGGLLDISLNLIDGSIYNNFLSGFCEIRFNGASVQGIFGQSVSQINSNNNSGSINDNSINGGLGSIIGNTNAGHIANHGNNGNITFNSNNGQINSNNISGDVSHNSNQGEIINNANQGSISNNSNAGTITANLSNVAQITGNSCKGGITDNNNVGGIFNNSNDGSINDNVSANVISDNSNSGAISENFCSGGITQNSNLGIIQLNGGDVDAITLNSNLGSISGNHCGGGSITNNSNNDSIFSNNIGGAITFNSNGGNIANNSNTGQISFNKNNGNIQLSDATITDILSNVNNGAIDTCSASVGTISITTNTNNGLISGSFAADVTDPVVNK